MKICQLCAVDFTLKNFLLPLVDGMRAQGWDVISVCSYGTYVENLAKEGYNIIPVTISRSMNPLKHVFSVLALVRLFRRERFDIVHVHTPVAALVGRFAARIVKVPLIIYTAHGFYFHDDMPFWKKLIFIALERVSGKFTDLLFTQSAEDAVSAVENKIIPGERLFSIGNGVDVSRFNPEKIGNQTELRLSLGIPEDAIVVGMIGRLVCEKGVIEFLDAANQIKTLYNNIWFVLVGEKLDSDHSGGVEQQVAFYQKELEKHLVITGLRSDIPQLLSIMDIFCLPSWREGMPRTIIEAMMMAKPVISTNIRGSREEVVAGKTGLLVPLRSAKDLANAIQRCIDQPSWAKKMGVEGRKRALQNYDERKIIDFQIEKIKLFAEKKGLSV